MTNRLIDNKKIYKKLYNDQRGFLVLTMVLIVSATVLAISLGILLRSIDQINETNDSEASLKAWSVVNACGEYALGQMATTTETLPGWTYTGAESLSIGGESCYIYSIESGDLESKLIKASSTVSSFTKKILIEVATNTPEVLINSWEEVSDF